MNKKRLFTALYGSLFILTTVWGQTAVTAGMMYGKKYGVTYMLPKTQIEIHAYATKHTFQPGEFCRYADLYLHLKDVKMQPEAYWTLDKTEVRNIGVADKDKIYFVELKDRTAAPLMELTEQGTIYSINLPYSGKRAETQTPQTAPSKTMPDPKSFFTEEILSATSTAKMAELVAREIYNIRESKNALIRGDADNMPKDGVQLQIMLDNLNMQEEALTSLFRGVDTTESVEMTFRVEPDFTAAEQVAFRFSQRAGIVDTDNLSGEPVYMAISSSNLISPPAADEKSKKELEGVAYNVPGKAKVTLTYKQKQLFNGELPFTQLGSVEYLANVLFNKSTTTTVLFDAETGALIKVDREEK